MRAGRRSGIHGRSWIAITLCLASVAVFVGCGKSGSANPTSPSSLSSPGPATGASQSGKTTPRVHPSLVATSQSDYAPGSTVTISGNNSNGAGYVSGNTVNVAVSGPNGWTSSCSATVGADGSWSCQITLSSDPNIAVGSYTYTATSTDANGNPISETGTFTDANPSNTSLSLAITPTSLTYGQTVTATGKLLNLTSNQGVPNASISLLDYSASGCATGTPTDAGSDTTDTGLSQGNYSISYRPVVGTGSHFFKASFAATPSLNASSSTNCPELTVSKAPTNTSITNTPLTTLALGNSLSVAYQVKSAYGVSPNATTGTVSINETDLNGTLGCGAGDSLNVTQSNADGSGASDAGFSATGTLSCTPTSTGIYAYHVGYSGDGNYQGSHSSPDNTLSVTSTVQVCEAAPAIAAHYMQDNNLTKPGSPKWRQVITGAAQQLGPNGQFFAQGVCDAGYAPAVIAWVITQFP